MAQRTILHIDLDAFFASVEQMLDPRLKGRPVIVGGHPGGRGVVASASYEARARGVKTAQPVGLAYRLCPDATFIPGNHEIYQAVSEAFNDILQQYSPFVEAFSIDEAWVDLTGFETLHGDGATAARAIKDQISNDLGITASIGVSTAKVVSKVASDREKPDGLVVVPPGHEAAFLAPLPARELPLVGPKVEAKLKLYGIHTIGQIAAQPPAALRALFGAHGAVLHRLANGQDASAVVAHRPGAKSVSRNTTLAQNTLDRERLRSTLYVLTERVAAELRRMERRAEAAVLNLRYYDFQTISRQHTLDEPSDEQQTLYQATAAMLDAALAERGEPVRLIGAGAQRLVTGGLQLSLFQPEKAERLKLNQTLDDLRQRYGFPIVQHGRALALKGRLPGARGAFVYGGARLGR